MTEDLFGIKKKLVWCEHIKPDSIDSRWELMDYLPGWIREGDEKPPCVPTNNWKCCPICEAPRPK